MTEKEAKNMIERLFSDSTDSAYPFTELFAESLRIAIFALEKQIPKKPIRVPVGKNGSSTDGCPVCKREFYEKFNCCPDCGTALDWSD